MGLSSWELRSGLMKEFKGESMLFYFDPSVNAMGSEPHLVNYGGWLLYLWILFGAIINDPLILLLFILI